MASVPSEYPWDIQNGYLTLGSTVLLDLVSLAAFLSSLLLAVESNELTTNLMFLLFFRFSMFQ